MMTEKSKSFMDSPEWKDIQDKIELSTLQYEKDCDEYWDNLSYDDKLKAFYSVVKRIVKGDIEENRSYRGVLYDVFGFDADAYGIGMEAGYLSLHNSIIPKDQQAEYNAWLKEKNK
jgi:hypothetical protein